ncbi:hypothetical protein GTA08_BOTSDO04210 [Botryosphaeria dothidea]|uniref:Uncharacterized protein n=1 Tax=Botryosphaeria dothidea TaxID=55169 RepID=A0A8H4IX82_9PEZI|nr:hypothetical protein GTA08_BOTSDO04210 [Botryosphaeria dothidea]
MATADTAQAALPRKRPAEDPMETPPAARTREPIIVTSSLSGTGLFEPNVRKAKRTTNAVVEPVPLRHAPERQQQRAPETSGLLKEVEKLFRQEEEEKRAKAARVALSEALLGLVAPYRGGTAAERPMSGQEKGAETTPIPVYSTPPAQQKKGTARKPEQPGPQPRPAQPRSYAAVAQEAGE